MWGRAGTLQQHGCMSANGHRSVPPQFQIKFMHTESSNLASVGRLEQIDERSSIFHLKNKSDHPLSPDLGFLSTLKDYSLKREIHDVISSVPEQTDG